MSMDLFYDKCKEHNLRITPQRITIYQELMHLYDHPSIETIYIKVRKKLSNISFDTVYRTVLSFSKIGLINLVEGYGEEMRFDPKTQHHHHLRCLKCRKIIDFYSNICEQIEIPKEVESKFKVVNKKIILEGYCENCKE